MPQNKCSHKHFHINWYIGFRMNFIQYFFGYIYFTFCMSSIKTFFYSTILTNISSKTRFEHSIMCIFKLPCMRFNYLHIIPNQQYTIIFI